jgi:hypothetical protein
LDICRCTRKSKLREFKIDKVKAILLLPINWMGINYANDKKYDQKLQDDAKLEIDIINNDIKFTN